MTLGNMRASGVHKLAVWPIQGANEAVGLTLTCSAEVATYRALKSAIACSRLAEYPLLKIDDFTSAAVIDQNHGRPAGACGWRNIRPMCRSPWNTS